MKERKNRVIAVYARVSSEQQLDNGPSLDNQIDYLRTIALHKFPSQQIETFRDVGTGRRIARPGYSAMIRAIKSGWVSNVMVTELSRLWRNTKDAMVESEYIRQYNCDIIAINQGIDGSTAMGKMFFGLFSVLAQWESDQTSDRVKRAQAVAFAAGRKGPGRRPYGWIPDEDGLLKRYPDEQACIDFVLERRAVGLSWDKIALELNRQQSKTVGGRDWEPGGLRLVMRSAVDRRAKDREKRQATGTNEPTSEHL